MSSVPSGMSKCNCGTIHDDEKCPTCAVNENNPPTLKDRRGVHVGMKACDQWIAWDYVTRGDDTTKPPHHASRGYTASAQDPDNWHTFDDAVTGAVENNLAGIGFTVTDDAPYSYIDIDVPDEGEHAGNDEWIPDFAPLRGAVITRSPSETSYRVWLRDAEKPNFWTNCSENGSDAREIAFVTKNKFGTVTGDTLDGFEPPIQPVEQDALDSWLRDAWAVFHDEPPKESETDDSDEKAQNKDPETGSSEQNPQMKGGENPFANVNVYDVLSRASYPEGERKPHPVHNSTTGANFKVDSGGETFACFSSGCNDGEIVTGNALHLVGMKEGLIECGEWMGSGLPSSVWNEIFDAAREREIISEGDWPIGGELTTDDVNRILGVDEPDENDEENANPWDTVRGAYADDERRVQRPVSAP